MTAIGVAMWLLGWPVVFGLTNAGQGMTDEKAYFFFFMWIIGAAIVHFAGK